MSDVITTLLPKNINELKAYSSAKSMKLSGSTWLNANESPYAKTFDVSLDNLNRYPDPQPQAVIDAYADYAGVSEENVLMTRGADEGIELLVRTFCEPSKDSISIFAPTYGMYKVTADTHNVALNVLSQEQLINDDKTTICEACAQSKLVFICNPNNPTGAILPVEKIAEIADELSGKAIVVVDEAYIEFCEAYSSVSLLQDFKNVVVLRTLSKAFALAGLRTGFMLSNSELLNVVRKVIAPYPVSTVVAAIAAQALSKDAITQVKRQVQILNAAKAELSLALKNSKQVITVLDSYANFVTIRLKDKAAIDVAMQSGLIIRPFVLFDQDDWIRISIGTEQELKQVTDWLNGL
jgi:histidinol-phosphate aminotransferase